MAKLKLTVACDQYDYLQPLREGKVQPQGIDLNLITVESGLRHQRMYRYGEYDACEFSMSSYLVARSQDVAWFQAIPFFPRRMFTHKFCFVRAGSGITRPSDLKGARIGLRSYENTLALVTKGMFHNTYGLPVTDVTWVIVNQEPVGSRLPPAIKIERVEGGWRLEDLLLQGKVDAEAEPDLPQAWLRGEGTVARLFPEVEKEERAYYQKSRIFPIMHPIVIKTEILKNDPWVATSLYEAFMASRRAYDEFMQQPHRLSFAWGRSYLEEERKFFGKHPFYQGFKENYHDVQTMITFAEQQGMLARPLTVEELFTENTRNT
ncbi:MAG TPA: ABC transporter substrate-binding protein [candidate division Zixibacteria bacterium]|nr:ABC transporter substrate-binding protein [candidate division Zixibacteria bacterium]